LLLPFYPIRIDLSLRVSVLDLIKILLIENYVL
jgi:hypothetical protein